MEKKGQKKRRQTKAKIAEAGFAFWLIRLICSRCRLRFPTPHPPPLPSLTSGKHFFWLAMSLPLFMSKALKIFHAFLWPVGEMQIECETKPLNMQQTDTEPYNRQIVACCLLFVACLLPSEGGSATYRISLSLQCQVQRFTEGTSLYTI